MSEDPGSAPRPRPTLTLPPRANLESLFRSGAGAGLSPGPMTLVSSFFAEDPGSDCRSFSELLAGAIASLQAAQFRRLATTAGEEKKVEDGSGISSQEQQQSPVLVMPSPTFFMVSPGLSPSGLLDSPAFFSSQFDANGNMLQNVSTKLAVSSYGEDELISLTQSLFIKQPPSRTLIAGDEDEETEWMEYKIKETNMFTVGKYQQIGFFPRRRHLH